MKKIKLGIIYGGMSTEHEISKKSFAAINNNVDRKKYEVYEIKIDTDGNWYYNEEKIVNIIDFLTNLDVVFPVLHGLYGEDGTIQGLLELMKIPYVGCGVLSSAVGMDKVYSKMLFNKAGLEQAKYLYIKKDNNKYYYVKTNFEEEEMKLNEIGNLTFEKLSFPVFVKPSRSGSSVGINKAHNTKELVKYVEEASKYDNKILIEENINGREIECAVIGNNDITVSMPGEIISGEEFYSYDAKYVSSSKTIIPNDIDNNLIDNLKAIAKRAYKVLDCKGLSRVDFFIENKTNRIIINEINTMPGFTEISMYPKLLCNMGYSYQEIIDKLIDLALKEK